MTSKNVIVPREPSFEIVQEMHKLAAKKQSRAEDYKELVSYAAPQLSESAMVEKAAKTLYDMSAKDFYKVGEKYALCAFEESEGHEKLKSVLNAKAVLRTLGLIE
jgi:hypothetical protein